MKKKILSVSSPSNPVEQQKAENAQAFASNISKIITKELIKNFSEICGMISASAIGASTINGETNIPSIVTLVLSLVVFVITNGNVMKNFSNLQELYDKKGNEVQVTEEQSKQDNGRSM